MCSCHGRKIFTFKILNVLGVEFAAELCDFVKEDLIKQYGKLSEIAQITLVHSRDHILNNYDEQVEVIIFFLKLPFYLLAFLFRSVTTLKSVLSQILLTV